MNIDRYAQLKALHLHGIPSGAFMTFRLEVAAAWQEWQVEFASQNKPVMPEAWLDRLIAAEQSDRQARSLDYQLQAATLVPLRALPRFDRFRLDGNTARSGTCRTTGNRQLYGSGQQPYPGRRHRQNSPRDGFGGGSHPLGQARKVLEWNAVGLVNQLDKEKQLGKAGSLGKRLIQMDAVIIDELGYLPFPQSGGALLFHLISQLYEKTSLIITTNLNFAEWGQVFYPWGTRAMKK